MGLAEQILKGDEKSAARLISLIEDGKQEGYRELSLLLPHTGSAQVVGVTGPPGAGKSTLCGRLAIEACNKRKKVGIVATDPTSIRGTGAFLGDRVRMKEAEKKNVFIRSMAHRGYPGGVARAATGAVFVLEGLGKDLIIVESAGAGQSEKALFYLCDTIVTVFTPDYGDEIQLLKAGLMEIGDILVVNKSDHPGAENAERDLFAYAARRAQDGWSVPVLLTRADQGTGVEAVAEQAAAHWAFLEDGGKREQKRKEKLHSFLMALLKEEAWKRFQEVVAGDEACSHVIERVENRKLDAYSAVEEILAKACFTMGDA